MSECGGPEAELCDTIASPVTTARRNSRPHAAFLRNVFVAMTACLLLSCAQDRGGAACEAEGKVGRRPGDLAENFSLRNQENQEVLLSDYCGQVVLIQMGAMWCPACQNEAEKIPVLMAKYGEQGFIVLDVMAETAAGASPGVNDLKAWADTYDLTTPVLADTDWQLWDSYFDTHSTPRALLIDRDGRLVRVDWFVSEEHIRNEL